MFFARANGTALPEAPFRCKPEDLRSADAVRLQEYEYMEATLNSPIETIVVSRDTVLTAQAILHARIVVEASNVVIDGNGATLQGPGTPGDIESFEGAGIAVAMDGCTNVSIKNLSARCFETGLAMRDCVACSVEGCDFSDNYDNKKFGWGELPARGAIICNGVKFCIFKANKGKNVWDGIHLRDSDDNLIMGNDFSHCSNVCAKLWNSSRNHFIENDISYGIRIDRAAGEIHARDSTSVLIESGSNDNYWFRNDATYGGDGIFIRPLNGWVSTGNVFIENDASYGNNNCIEAWSPGNVYIRNKANHGSYGFWLGGSDRTLLIGNEADWNGLPDGFHNAPEPAFEHGGIVIVGSSATECLLEGNRCRNNNGGGIVFRGDVASKGADWQIKHWVLQHNVLQDNRWGIYGRFGDSIFVGPNDSHRNKESDALQDVDRVWLGQGDAARAPRAVLAGSGRAYTGVPVVFDASLSRDPAGNALSFRWDVGGTAYEGPAVSHVFDKPGLYGVSLTVSNETLAAVAGLSVLVASGDVDEVGTEGQAADWVCDGGRCFDDPDAIEGRYALRFTTTPLKEGLPWATYPASGDAALDLRTRRVLSFWFKARNTNVFCWQNKEIAVRLVCPRGEFRFEPASKGRLWGPARSAARDTWQWLEIPLAGDENWTREVLGEPDLSRVDAVAIALDSAEDGPFTVWIDGLTFA